MEGKMRNCFRDITVKEIGEQHIGQTLRVAGWIENIRDHGGVSFLDLRDMYGVLQVVIRKDLIDGFDPAPYNVFAGQEHWTKP